MTETKKRQKENNPNLWNTNNKKYSKAKKLIKELQPLKTWNDSAKGYEYEKTFEEIKKQVLKNSDTANQLLEGIGYINHQEKPLIYEWSEKMKVNKE